MSQAQTAFVTGGARRVGRAVVERLTAAGWHVVFTYNRSENDADALVQRIDANGCGTATPLHFDAGRIDAAAAAADVVRSTFNGRLDLLVNSASMYLADDHGAEDFQARMFQVNATSPAALMQAFGPALSAARGSVVNFIDLLAERPWPKYSAYCASKAALHSLTLSYARKLAPLVRVNGIAPGVIDWPDDMPEADRAAYLKKVPLGRAGTPTDAAGLVLQLAESMPYVTGQVIRLDGGRSLV